MRIHLKAREWRAYAACRAGRGAAFLPYQMTSRHLQPLGDGGVFLPCTPGTRCEEVSEDAMLSSRCENHAAEDKLLDVQNAIMEAVTAVERGTVADGAAWRSGARSVRTSICGGSFASERHCWRWGLREAGAAGVRRTTTGASLRRSPARLLTVARSTRVVRLAAGSGMRCAAR